MLVIRLLRTGKKNQPSFKIVVVEKEKSSTSGRYIEEVGFYNPLTKERILKAERIKYWISVGAQPSETIHNMLISQKVIEGKKIDLHKKSKKKEEASVEQVVAPVTTPAKEEVIASAPEIEPKKEEEPKKEKPAKEAKVEPVKEKIEEKPTEEVKAEPVEEKKEEKPEEKKE
ncbi:MAG TPA: 30S ribosomal protein S16 [Candidatus Paceibacterota bacterium]|nr:30S ribosomal protein S16 [Candidatus Paceibacterota bacterium]